MAVREQGAKARLRVLHFGEELLATAGAAKYGYDALNMRNVFMKIPRREGDVAEEGQWRRVYCTEPDNWHAISCRPQQSDCGRTKLFSAGCLTIYRWRRSSPWKTSTQSLMLNALLPSGGTC